MPRSLLSSRYNNFASIKANNKMSETSKCSKISDPLKRKVNTRRSMNKHFGTRVTSYQSSLLQSNEWLTSDLIPITIRYELEKRHNIELMSHYGDEDNNTEESESTDAKEPDIDSNVENVYFDPTPRKINFDVLEIGNNNSETNDQNDGYGPRHTIKKLLGDEASRGKRFTCDVCNKFFEKRWTLNSHMLSHSGDKPFRCTYKTCSKQYADRSNLRAHQRSKMHHSWKIFCNQCTKPFSEQRYLNLHSLSACRKYLTSISKKIIP